MRSNAGLGVIVRMVIMWHDRGKVCEILPLSGTFCGIIFDLRLKSSHLEVLWQKLTTLALKVAERNSSVWSAFRRTRSLRKPAFQLQPLQKPSKRVWLFWHRMF